MLLKSQQRTTIDNIYMNRRQCLPDSVQALLEMHPLWPNITSSRHPSNCILLNWVLLCCPICCHSIQLHTVFALLYFCLYSSTSLHQHGTFAQPGEESEFTKESRNPPWEITCTCIQEDSQCSLAIKYLNCNQAFRYRVREH